jgi:hypothetical protein
MVHSGATSSESTLSDYLVQTFQYPYQPGVHCSFEFTETAVTTYWGMAGRLKRQWSLSAFRTGTVSKRAKVFVDMYLRMCVADCYAVADRRGGSKW